MPIKEHDHALEALRYLVARMDQGKVARWKRWWRGKDEEPPVPAPPAQKFKWLSLYNVALWTPICTVERG